MTDPNGANVTPPEFEGLDPYRALQPSGEMFWSKNAAQEVSGNGSLPPGAEETPPFTKRTPAVTSADFIKNTAA